MNTESSKGSSSRKDLDNFSEIALEIQKGLKALDYYQDGHPALNTLIDSAFNSICARLKGMETVSLSVKRRGLYSGFHQVGKGIKPLLDFAKELYIRGVRKVFILQGLTINDFNTFLRAVHMTPKEIKEAGSVETVLLDRYVKSIWVNEINYDKLISRDLEYVGETDDVSSVQAENLEVTANKKASLAREQEERPKEAEDVTQEVVEEKSLGELLEEIKNPIIDKHYRQILGLMVPLIVSEVAAGRLELPVKILYVLSDHLDLSTQLSHERERLTLTKIREIASLPILKFLADKLCGIKEDRKTAPLLLKVGDPAVNVLLDSLSNTEDRHCRRMLVDVISKFGSSASKRIKDRLYDDRWFVIRNMASILGEIGNRDSLSALDKLLEHSDIRVKKEAIKALSKVGGNEAATILIKRSDKIEKELHALIFFSLGVIEEPVAIPLLLKKLNKKSLFLKDIDARKESILALGKLGAVEAIETLDKILSSSHFFKKEPEEIKLIAAQSLAMIGNEDAIQAIENAYISGKGKLKEVCHNYLSKMK